METALFYLREIAGNLTLDPAAAKTEAGVVLSELRLRDVPGFRALKARLNLALVDPHATALPNGDPDIIAQAPVDQLRAFYNAYYRPDRATLIVVGDIDPADLAKQVQKLFGDWNPANTAGTDPVLSIPFKRPLQTGTYAEAGAPTSISMSWIAPPKPRPETSAQEKDGLVDFVALRILNRRFQEAAATPEHPFNAAGASQDQALNAAYITSLSINYGTGDWRVALAAAEAIRQDVLRNGVTQDEVDRTMVELHAGFAAGAAAATTRPSPRIADGILEEENDHDIFTDPRRDLAALDSDMKGLTPAQVDDAFRKMFSEGQPLIFVSGPKAIEGGDAAVKQAFDAAEKGATASRTAQVPALPWSHVAFGTPGKVTERREVADLGVTYVTFANGVRLTVRPSKLRANQVLVAVKIGDGRLTLPRDRATAAWAAPGTLIRGGLTDMSYTDMQRTLASKIYGAAFSTGEDGFVLSGATIPTDLDVQLQVLAAYVTAPGYRPEGFQQAKSQLNAQLEQIDSNPSAVFGAKAPQFLHQGDMRWKYPTQDDVNAARLDDVKALLAPAFANGPMDIIITGDTSVDAAIKSVAATFGALPARSTVRAAVTKDNGTALPAGGADIALSHTGSPGQDIASVLWPVPGRFPDIQDDVTQSLAADIMEERLFDKLRGIGLTYVAQVGGSSSKVFDYGYIQAYSQIPRGQMAQFDSALNAIVTDIQAGHITPEELERARVPALENLQKAQQTNEYWLTALDDTAEHPAKLTLIRDYEKDLRAVTAADIAAVARKYLVPGHMIRVNVGQ
jgi:zinc protease